MYHSRVFPRRFTSGSRILFKNNRLLFFLLLSGNFCGVTKHLMEGDKVVIVESSPSPLHYGHPCHINPHFPSYSVSDVSVVMKISRPKLMKCQLSFPAETTHSTPSNLPLIEFLQSAKPKLFNQDPSKPPLKKHPLSLLTTHSCIE